MTFFLKVARSLKIAYENINKILQYEYQTKLGSGGLQLKQIF